MKRFSAASNNMESNRQRIYLATGNAHKVQEFQQLAESTALPAEFVRPGIMPEVVEDTGTFVGNAQKKAMTLGSVMPVDAWILADDSGLCVDELDGAPGVESAYYAGPNGDARANLAKLVRELSSIPEEKRTAYFVCVLVLQIPGSEMRVFEGRCAGTLLGQLAGGNGFGYDPIFVPNGYAQTYAELDEQEKNKISHRGRAFAALRQWLIISKLLG